MNPENLYIANDYDKPDAWLLCTGKPSGNGKYLNKRAQKACPVVNLSENASSLADFGFTLIGELYKQTKESRAIYRDGTPRKWQGLTEFTLKDI